MLVHVLYALTASVNVILISTKEPCMKDVSKSCCEDVADVSRRRRWSDGPSLFCGGVVSEQRRVYVASVQVLAPNCGQLAGYS